MGLIAIGPSGGGVYGSGLYGSGLYGIGVSGIGVSGVGPLRVGGRERADVPFTRRETGKTDVGLDWHAR
ncbi:MAG: hypothetical protein ACR2F6_05645 [Mycobacteriales bacterium]